MVAELPDPDPPAVDKVHSQWSHSTAPQTRPASQMTWTMKKVITVSKKIHRMMMMIVRMIVMLTSSGVGLLGV